MAAIATLEVDVTVARDADAAALAGIFNQAGLATHGRLKYRNALIRCDEVRQDLSAIQAGHGDVVIGLRQRQM
jgi:hypothetical protein